MKKKPNVFQRFWDYITFPFIGIAILIDEDRRLNDDGYWDKHWQRQVRKRERQERRAAKRAARQAVK